MKKVLSISRRKLQLKFSCSLVRWNPKEHFSESISKMVVGGSCTAIAKKMKINPMIPAFTANKRKSSGAKLDTAVTQLLD